MKTKAVINIGQVTKALWSNVSPLYFISHRLSHKIFETKAHTKPSDFLNHTSIQDQLETTDDSLITRVPRKTYFREQSLSVIENLVQSVVGCSRVAEECNEKVLDKAHRPRVTPLISWSYNCSRRRLKS